jgi:hypothetical protein
VSVDRGEVLRLIDAALEPVRVALRSVPRIQYVGDTGEPAFENSWQAYSGGGFGDPGFYVDRGRVWFVGLANRGAAALTLSSLFTLPPDLWPRTSVDLSTWSSTGAGVLAVSPAGVVALAAGPLGPGGNGSYVILEGLSYRPDVRA